MLRFYKTQDYGIIVGMEKLQSNLEEIVERLFGERTRVELGLAPEGTGADYATNVAMKLAKVVRKSPMEIAEEIGREVESDEYEVSVAAPGFLNFRMRDDYFVEKVRELATGGLVVEGDYAGKMVITEFSKNGEHHRKRVE